MAGSSAASASHAKDAGIGVLAFATMFVIGTDTFLVSPLLPLLRDAFGVDVPTSGWLVSAYAIGYIASALVAGPISDRVDRRRMLVGGMIAFAAATAACALAWSFWSLFALRFLAGVAAAVATPQIWAAIPVLSSQKNMMRTMGLATTGLSAAQVAGIPIGAALASVSWHAAFVFVGVAAAAVSGLLATYFPAVPTAAADSKDSGEGTQRHSGYAAVAASRPLMLGLTAYLVFQTGTFAAFSFFGTWFDRDFSLSTAQIGLAMLVVGAGQAVGSLFGHLITARLGRARSLFVGVLCMAACYTAVAFVNSLPLAIGVLAMAMAFAGALFPVLMATLQGPAGSARGTVSSLANVAMYAGTTIGAAAAGPIFVGTRGFSGVAVLVIVCDLAALAVFWLAGMLRDT